MVAKTIAIVNQKGGVGKTTTCVNLAAALVEKGKRVLLCDFDPQANSTSGMGVDKTVSKGVYEVLIEESPTADAIVHTKFGDVLPSNKALAGAGIELIGFDHREFLLKTALDQVAAQYDFIFIDCPPSLGLLAVNALVASDGVIIPIQCEFYALEGVSQLMKTVGLVRREMNKKLQVTGVILSMYDGRTNLGLQVIQEVKRFFGNKVFGTVIPKNVRLAEAPSYGLSIVDYDPSSKGAKAYKKLAEEFLQREGR